MVEVGFKAREPINPRDVGSHHTGALSEIVVVALLDPTNARG
jgi:hypothetical protein